MKMNNQKKMLPWFMWSIAVIFYTYEYFLRVAPSVMLHNIMDTLHIDVVRAGILSSAYYWAYTPMQLFVGVLFDRFGVRVLLVIAVLACALGSAFFSLSHVYYIAMFGRFLVGFGSAFAFVSTLKIASDWMNPSQYALLSGMATAIGMLGAILGEISLSRILNTLGYYKTTWLLIAVAALLATASWCIILDKRTRHSLKKESLSNVFKDLKRLITTWDIWLNGMIGGLLFLPTTLFAVLWGVSYFKDIYHLNNHIAAELSSTIFFGWIVGGPFVGWLSGKLHQRKKILAIGCASALLIISTILYAPNLSIHTIQFLLFCFGMASSVQILVFAISLDLVPNKLAGTVTALTNMLVMFAGFFQPLVAFLLTQHAHNATIYTQADYQHAFSIIPIALSIAFLLILLLKESYHD